MFGKKKRAPQPRGQGAAAAKQMGLFVDLDPEEMMMGMEGNLDDPDLEAELAAITGNKAAAGGRARPKGKSPLPMEDIARMADECMRDVDDDEDDDDIEDDEDLLAELQEVVGEEEAEDAVTPSSASSSMAESSQAETPESPVAQQREVKASSAAPGSLQHTLEGRVAMYKMALQNAKTAGETSKARRYDRGLKTLESMLAAVKKGRPVNEAEIPPPVATGAPSDAPRPAVPARPPPPVPSPRESTQQEESEALTPPPAVPTIITPSSEEEQSSLPTVSSLPSPEENAEEAADLSQTSQTDANEATKTLLLERQKEYKMAALRAKKQGDVEQAKLYFKTSKRFDAVIEALEKGQAIDLSGLPPSPGQGAGGSSAPVNEPSSGQNMEVTQPVAAAPAPAPPSAPDAPKDVLEALEQRRAKYVEASTQAKASGDDRKARMHDRIAKQYQSAIRSHKAGRAVNFDELPVPPGFPPIPGQKATGAEQGFVAALEAASKLASTDAAETAEDDDEDEKEDESKPAVPEEPKKPTLDVPTAGPRQKRSPSASPDRTTSREGLSPTAVQQLEFLEGRKKQYMKAALQAKQKNDMEQAKMFLRTAKGFDPMIEAARSGKTVDISTVPSPPGDEDDDFILVHHSDVQISEKAEQVYTQLAKILKEQYEKCMTHSKQFTHLGNVAETTKFEKMAESCKKSLEVLKLAQSRGLPPPKHHFEERSFRTVRIFPDLSSTDMVIIIVKGMNLPAPSGIQTNDLDAYVKFDFPYPSTEQPQKHKTAVIKNTNCPEYNQSFTLSINRNHRGFRRVVTSKGLKLELLHKGGFLRSDKPIGTALLKLDKLESQSEIREIVEVMDGRKATGGRVEVKVRLREPLSGQDMQSSTERWLVIDPAQVLV
ncbi:coiled-coil and C2 domain-containing protein 1B isoform X1 [Stegastes partitus]|uniref:Coiled-coil and C2 domain-containing protein 1B n=1 Tax=Stegastes partitus TaxID=144197 RepID=A0A3B5AK02_9TELE|nr:PREDICTED: coiled-coil and C2 domain-containing protein 1B isoform X1 [Stegastes partitus]XP_008277883.1 PREDICTED: coiled-coil and C2 domain-containing protein 1B isoform X1 [Stegastes partitus]